MQNTSESSRPGSGGCSLIFVGGAPRSGTTLVQRMLDSHPEIFGGPEFDRIREIVNLRGRLYASIKQERIHTLVSGDQVDGAVCALIENLLYPAAERHGKKYISEKTPANVLMFAELAQICPRARFVFVSRDPRDVVSSLKDVRQRYKKKHGRAIGGFNNNFRSGVKYTRRCTLAGMEFARLNPRRCFSIRYEELLKDPASISKELCRFLDIPWSETMLNPEQASKGNREAVGVDNVWYDNKMYSGDIQTDKQSKWREKLTGWEIAYVEHAFRSVECGYTLDAAKISIPRKYLLVLDSLVDSGASFVIQKIVRLPLLAGAFRYLKTFA